MIGEIIDGRYRILRVLGEGGMGSVYEAEHTGTGRRVAVKVIVADLAARGEMVARFQREARAAGGIETPHIVQVLDTGTDQATGTVYMVMELLRGEDLQSLVDRVGPLPPELALRIAGQACIGLQRAHEAGVIHRDIKPANLFLSRTEGDEILVKVVDFGIAKIKVDVTGSREVALTRTGGLLGSPTYMSPEQAVGKKDIDHRTDVWSLGVVLYAAIAGHVPHPDAETLGALIMAICSKPAPPLRRAAPWVPDEVAALVHRALAIDLDERYESIGALRDAILDALPERRTSIRADSLVPVPSSLRVLVEPRHVSPDAATVATPSPATAPSRRSARSRRLAPVALGALGLGAAALAVVGYNALVRGAGAAPASAMAVAPPPPPLPFITASSAPPTVAPATSDVAASASEAVPAPAVTTAASAPPGAVGAAGKTPRKASGTATAAPLPPPAAPEAKQAKQKRADPAPSRQFE